MASISIGTFIKVQDKNEKDSILKVINKSYTPQQKKERLEKIKKNLKPTDFKIIN